MKTGFVNIFGKPNAGKSTLMNALLDEKLAIVSHKSQTTRHRIKGILNKSGEYQIVLSDTPGIIAPEYRLHEHMMQQVKSALEDADVALLIADVSKDIHEAHEIFAALKLNVPCIIILNKIDKASKQQTQEAVEFFNHQSYCKKVITISASNTKNFDELLNSILEYLPEGQPFYNEDDLTDLPTRFFVGELIREKIYLLLSNELPYETAVLINEFKEKESLIKIHADIIVQRESQKAIVLGEKGSMIKKIGTMAREDIERFLQQKIYLQLFVKVRPKWRNNERQLKEYGY